MHDAEPTHLTTGWEPDVPVDDTELRRFVHAWSASLAGPVEAMGGRVVRDGEVVVADLGRPAAYHNGATLLAPLPADGWYARLEAIEAALLGGAGTGDVFLWSAWPTPDLRRRGWVLEGHPPLLLRPRSGPCPPPGSWRRAW